MMFRLLAAIMLLSMRLSVAQGPSCVSESNTDASSLGQLSSQLMPKLGKVRFHRDEQLEDRLRTHRSESSPVPRIYQIQAEPSGDEVFTYRLPTMYVAVSRDGSAVYQLAGFPDAERHFDELVRDQLTSPIRTKEEAESRGLLCAEIVYGTSPSWWTDGKSSVQLKAAQHFFSEGHQDALTLASQWWKSTKGNRTELAVATLPKGDGFEVNLPVFWAPVEGHSTPEVRLYRININYKGACSMPTAPSVVLQ
jgi:hypothetical protein